MKKLAYTAFAMLATWGALQIATPAAQAGPHNCDNVRCAACAPGFHPSLVWPNCCECIPD